MIQRNFAQSQRILKQDFWLFILLCRITGNNNWLQLVFKKVYHSKPRICCLVRAHGWSSKYQMPVAIVTQWRSQRALHEMTRDSQHYVLIVIRNQLVISPCKVSVPQRLSSGDFACLIRAQILLQAWWNVHGQHKHTPVIDRQGCIFSKLFFKPI